MNYFNLTPIVVLIVAGQAGSAAFTPLYAIKAKSVIQSEDVIEVGEVVAGSVQHIDEFIGQEAKITLYPGHVILLSDIEERASVERNATVTIEYIAGVLSINTEGRALERGKVGDTIKVMNMESKVTVVGTITGDGIVEVRK